MVSGSWSQRGQRAGCCKPRQARQSVVQHRSRWANQWKNLTRGGAQLFQVSFQAVLCARESVKAGGTGLAPGCQGHHECPEPIGVLAVPRQPSSVCSVAWGCTRIGEVRFHGQSSLRSIDPPRRGPSGRLLVALWWRQKRRRVPQRRIGGPSRSML